MNNPSTPRCWCQYCGSRLDVMQQVLPRRTLILVTCWKRGCAMFEFTLGDREHRRIARRIFRQVRLHTPAKVVGRAKAATKA